MNRNKLDGAKELKKMVFFSNIVVAPLLEDLKARPQLLTAFEHIQHTWHDSAAYHALSLSETSWYDCICRPAPK